MNRLVVIGAILITILSLCRTVYRDIQIEKLYPPDLRNRVVGARLQMDGKMPYFHKWKPDEGLRYYDLQNFDTFKVSNNTASPYFHQLMYPVANMQQRTISRLWIGVQYVLLLLMTIMAFRFCQTRMQQLLVLAVAISFLYTESWINLIAAGQMYLFIPFLAMLCYYLLNKPTYITGAVLAGLFAVSLTLIRPNTVIMFFPLLFLLNKYSVRYKIAFIIPVILLLGYIAGSERQRALWIDYAQSLKEQLKIHQNLHPAIQDNGKDPGFIKWEGWNMDDVRKEESRTSYKNYSENGNLFVVVRGILGIHLSTTVLNIYSFLLILILMLSFYFFFRNQGFTLYNAAIFGFCLYMVSDLFSPIYRHQYYTIQWLFPLLLAAAGYVKNYKWIYALIVLGIFLNIINITFIKMEHTIGEYIIFAALLTLSFVYNHQKHIKPQS